MTTMAVEMSANRLIAPFFGTSVFIWTNIIGVIMITLSAGYYWGGKLADRHPNHRTLYILVLFSAVILLVLPLVAPFVFQFASGKITETNVSLVFISFITTLLIIGFPFIFLGMISPFISRLITHSFQETGSAVGQVFAISTIGSILGTFLPTLFLIPMIGTKKTILLFATLLLVISILGLKKKRLLLVLILPLWLYTTTPTTFAYESDIIFQDESPYSFILIRKDEQDTLSLEQGTIRAVSSIYNEDKILTGSYWDYILLGPYFQPEKKEQKIAVLGSAGGTTFRILQELLGDIFSFTIDGAEIDSRIIDIAKEYFDSNYENVHIHAKDARLFLRQSEGEYDTIFLDAYHNLYIPPHLTTLEFFKIVDQKLAQDGVFMININVFKTTSSIMQRTLRTLKEVFSNVWYVKMGDNKLNYIILATNGQGNLNTAIENLMLEQEGIATHAQQHAIPISIAPNAPIITDDQPLTEVIFDKMIIDWLANI